MSEKDVQVLKYALDECEEKLREDPDFHPLLSVRVQLQYLLGIVRDGAPDRSRLKDIIIGIYAVREFEMRDMEFAKRLYDVDEIVDRLKQGRL